MIKLNIKVLQSLNGITFGLSQDAVRKMLGLKFTKPENHFNEPEVQELWNKILDVMVDISKKPKEHFIKIAEETEEITKSDYNDDYYEGFNILYSDDLRFEAVEVFAGYDVQLIVNGVDCSDFSLKKLFALSDDFILEDELFYTSYTKQISFRLSEDDDEKAECILFGKQNYYQDNEM